MCLHLHDITALASPVKSPLSRQGGWYPPLASPSSYIGSHLNCLRDARSHGFTSQAVSEYVSIAAAPLILTIISLQFFLLQIIVYSGDHFPSVVVPLADRANSPSESCLRSYSHPVNARALQPPTHTYSWPHSKAPIGSYIVHVLPQLGWNGAGLWTWRLEHAATNSYL